MVQPVPSAVMVVGGEQSIATSYGPGEPKSVTGGNVMTQEAAPSVESPTSASPGICDEASSELGNMTSSPASSADADAPPVGPGGPAPSGCDASGEPISPRPGLPSRGRPPLLALPPHAVASTASHNHGARRR